VGVEVSAVALVAIAVVIYVVVPLKKISDRVDQIARSLPSSPKDSDEGIAPH
jgi:uncharacterized protein YoxC